jgi:3-oxoacyl-[acyl-carrier-protein] synthase-3
MIGIAAIGTYVPAGGQNVLERSAEFNLNEDFVRNKTGFLRTARKSPDEDTTDLGLAAVRDLQSRIGLNDLSDIDCLVVCTQNPDRGGIPHSSAILHGKLGLGDDVAAFDIGLACSGYVYALSIVKSFMEANDLRNGILVTADPYSKVINEADKNTAILFGDGATATLLNDTPKWAIGPVKFGTRGANNKAITIGDDDHLTMNGRAVFAFSASTVPGVIQSLVSKAGKNLADIDLFLLHQGSRYIVSAITSALKIDPEKVPFGAADTGNTVSSSIPMLLADVDTNHHECVVIAGFGAGLSWASMILEPHK